MYSKRLDDPSRIIVTILQTYSPSQSLSPLQYCKRLDDLSHIIVTILQTFRRSLALLLISRTKIKAGIKSAMSMQAFSGVLVPVFLQSSETLNFYRHACLGRRIIISVPVQQTCYFNALYPGSNPPEICPLFLYQQSIMPIPKHACL